MMALHSADIARFSWGALRGYPARTLLMLLAMSIGVGSVVILTALGEGARRYVMDEFASLGTNLVIIFPGRSETTGIDPSAMMGETTRDLTLDDAQALLRSTRVKRMAPLNVGQADVSRGSRSREVVVLGASHDLLAIRHWQMAQGQFLPSMDLDRAAPVAVIGKIIRDELFGADQALGEWIRLGDRRFRVIGVVGSEGRSIGVDVQETVIIPVASAQQMFNTSSLFRMLVEAKSREAIEPVKQMVIEVLQKRHQGEKDVTVVTQDAVLATFDEILGALTYAVGGIAAISLAVAGILIMNVMLVAISERTCGDRSAQGAGGVTGTDPAADSCRGRCCSRRWGGSAGWGWGSWDAGLSVRCFPILPAYAPGWVIGSVFAVALITGLLFSLLPARRAARLDPVLALSGR